MRLAPAMLMLLVALCAPSLDAATTTTVADVATPRGTIRIAHFRPDTPLANLIVLPGGNGVFGLQPNGLGNDYFQVHPTTRNREAFIAAGYSVIVVDAPADMQDGSMTVEYRSSPEHMAELREVLRTVRGRDNLPTWVIGGSLAAADAATLAVGEPNTSPFGLILVSPYYDSVLKLNLESLQRPTLLLTHRDDSCIGTLPENAPLVMARITATPARRYVQYTGGSGGPAGCEATGPHGLGGLDAEFVAEVTSWMRLNAYFVQPANYQGLWYAAPAESEAGWGVNVTQQGTVLFATWFTYDADRSGIWLVMPQVTRTADGVYTGQLYRTTGPPFSNSPWRGTIGVTPVGSATFTFSDSYRGTFAYVVNGVAQSKAITRQVFSQPVPACIAGVAHLASPNYQALWYASPAESESGWGVNVTHQGDLIFATWFTYGADGRGIWLVMPRGERTASGVFTGDFYQTRGAPFSASPWQGPVEVTRMGTGTFTFTSANAGVFSYTIGNVSQSKAITRQVFAAPESVCR